MNTSYTSEESTEASEKDWGTNGTSPTRAYEIKVDHDGTCEMNSFSSGKDIKLPFLNYVFETGLESHLPLVTLFSKNIVSAVCYQQYTVRKE